MRKRKLIKDVDYVLLSDVLKRHTGPTKIVPGRDTLNKNSWEDVISWCEMHNLKPSDIYSWVAKRHRGKTTAETNKIGIIIYDSLQLNKKKKKSIRQSERAVILHCRKEIIKIHKNKTMSDTQLYRVGKKSLERTAGFLLFDKEQRKKFGY